MPVPIKARPIEPSNYIEEAINADILAGKVQEHIHTRLPPEPNGYLHIGHAKNIYINAGIAGRYGGLCNLRFDDTNPAKEDTEYVEAIMQDIRWLGYDWTGGLFFGSQYFGQCYSFAEKLIRKGKAFVCDLTQDEIRDYRGTLTTPGLNSPYRDRTVEENLDLFHRMRSGEFENGTRVLRAKIDMASPNINLRDPVIYRILHITHHQTGDEWCIYPMYDFAHPIQDALEHITHSLCSLEYEDHRPLYDWVIEELEFEHRPRQIEYARLNLTNTVMSKRYLRQLVEQKLVTGWDDPRMPTLCGLRRRGYTPSAIRDFIARAGVAKADSMVDIKLLEHCIREELNETAPRVMAVLDPLKVVIMNWPEGKTEEITLENHPGNEGMGSRKVLFSRDLFIDREDFMEDPPGKFFRLKPGGEVRLKGAYIIKCEDVIKDSNGSIVELHCTYDPASRSGDGEGRKIKGTLHWVEESTAITAEVRLYDVLFNDNEGEDYAARLNKESFTVLEGSLLEGSLAAAKPGDRFQFMRQGYFICDPDTRAGAPVFNRIVGLKDSWAKEVSKAVL